MCEHLKLINLLFSGVIDQGPELLSELSLMSEHLLAPVSSIDDKIGGMLLEARERLIVTSFGNSRKVFIHLVFAG